MGVQQTQSASAIISEHFQEGAILPLYEVPLEVNVLCLRSPEIIDHHMGMILENTQEGRCNITVGFDCEWRFVLSPYYKGKVALIQIAYKNQVFIIQTLVSERLRQVSRYCHLL
jgi:hypothetical protein